MVCQAEHVGSSSSENPHTTRETRKEWPSRKCAICHYGASRHNRCKERQGMLGPVPKQEIELNRVKRPRELLN